jgi:hypothetical protein
VVHGSVVAGEGDEARVLTQAVLELGSDLAAPVLEPLWRVVDYLVALRDSELAGGIGGRRAPAGSFPALAEEHRDALPCHTEAVRDLFHRHALGV